MLYAKIELFTFLMMKPFQYVDKIDLCKKSTNNKVDFLLIIYSCFRVTSFISKKFLEQKENYS